MFLGKFFYVNISGKNVDYKSFYNGHDVVRRRFFFNIDHVQTSSIISVGIANGVRDR